jgi:hypothetical protein
MKRIFVSGHLDLTVAEFDEHYAPRLRAALAEGAFIVVGDARGTDAMTQALCRDAGYRHVVVYHMREHPRTNVGDHAVIGGFQSDAERDVAMTGASDEDIAWVRPGREKSGTARNLARRRGA